MTTVLLARMSKEIHIGGIEHCTEIRCSILTVTGAATVEQDVHAQDMSVSGSLVINKDMVVETLSISGSLRVSGDLHAQHLTCSGYIYVEGTTECDVLIASGEIDLNGLNCGCFFGSNTTAKNMVAESFCYDENNK